MRALLAFLLLVLASPALAQDFPQLTGRVVDAANVIPDDREAALTAQLETLEKETTRQLVIATVPDLQGYDVSEYGYKLGDFWKIGQKGENNGLILLVAPKDRKVRVEVGNGLGDVVPDVLASRIIRNDVLPQFKAGDIPAGIEAGTASLIALVKLPPGEAIKQASALQSRQQNEGVSLGSIIFWLFIFFFFILPLMRGLFGRSRGRRYGSGPVIIWSGGGADFGGGSSWSGGSSWGDSGGFSGGGGEFGGGGASGDW